MILIARQPGHVARVRRLARGNRGGQRVRRRLRFVGLASGLTLVGGMLVASAGATSPPASAASARIRVEPMVTSRLASTTQPLTEAQCVADFTAPCYDPAQIQKAYNEGPLFSHGITGAGETIVIVDAFGSPTIQSDLATFDSTFGLPAPPSFNIIQPAGHVRPWNPKRQRHGRLGRRDHPRRRVVPHHGPRSEHPPGRDAGVGDRGYDRLPPDRQGRELRHRPSPRGRDQPEFFGHRADLPDGPVPAPPAKRLYQRRPATGSPSWPPRATPGPPTSPTRRDHSITPIR